MFICLYVLGCFGFFVFHIYGWVKKLIRMIRFTILYYTTAYKLYLFTQGKILCCHCY